MSNGVIWGKIGPEGSGKDTIETFFDLIHIREGGQVQTFPGYDIHRNIDAEVARAAKKRQAEEGGDIKLLLDQERKRLIPLNLLSKQLNIREWLTNPAEYSGLIVSCSEIQNFMGSEVSGAVFARLVNRVMATRRHYKLSFDYNVQNWMWVHNRIRWLTHLLTICYDLSWSSWGKAERVERGEVIQLTTFDCKGFYTGKPFSMMGVKVLRARPIWPYFYSEMPIDIFAGEKKWLLKKPVETLDLATMNDIHGASPMGQAINRSPEMPDMGYSTQRERDQFERGMEAVDRGMRLNEEAVENYIKQGAMPKQIDKLNAELRKRSQRLEK